MTGIPDEAVNAATNAALEEWMTHPDAMPLTSLAALDLCRSVRAGLAAALPHLAGVIRHDGPSRAAQIAVDASEPSSGTRGPAGQSQTFSAACTGLTAQWCPTHGTCTCPDRDHAMNDGACLLHSYDSKHPTVTTQED